MDRIGFRITTVILRILPVLLVLGLFLTGCAGSAETVPEPGIVREKSVEPIPAEELAAVSAEEISAAAPSDAGIVPDPVPEPETESSPEPVPDDTAEDDMAEAEQEPVQEPELTEEPGENEEEVQEAPAVTEEEPVPVLTGGRVVVIDPGHSANIPSGTEPLGPGSPETKAKDAVGTRGSATGIMEYELVLQVSMLLQNELTARGYTVVMTRTSNSDSISCMERAQVANNAGAAAYIRVHADGAESASAHGASVLSISSSNPYTPSTYAACRRLSESVISSYCAATGCYNRGVVETDAMSGNNWSSVPTTLIELGFMTNPEEDVLMSTAEYQAKMVRGIADGIDAYMNAQGQ